MNNWWYDDEKIIVTRMLITILGWVILLSFKWNYEIRIIVYFMKIE